MSVVATKTKILIVEKSPVMLKVLKNFSEKQGYHAECFSDPLKVSAALQRHSGQLDADYRCLLLGWSEDSIIDKLPGQLSSADYQNVPVIVLCQSVTAEIEALVKRRPGIRTLLWKDYREVAQIIDQLQMAKNPASRQTPLQQKVAPVKEGGRSVEKEPAKIQTPVRTKVAGTKALILDNAPSVNHGLRGLMERHGYDVTIAGSVAEGCKAIESQKFDLVVTDFFLRGEGGEEFCRYLQSADKLPGEKPLCLVMSSKYSDVIVKRSLSVGAIACLNKDEPTEMMFARIDALVQAMPALPSDKGVSNEPEGSPKRKPTGAVFIDRRLETQSAKPRLAKAVGVPDAKNVEASMKVDSGKKPHTDTSADEPLEAESQVPAASASTEPVVATVEEFSAAIDSALNDKHGRPRHSVLVLDIQLVAATGDRLSLGYSEPMLGIVKDALAKLYTRENSFTYLGNGQFGYLLTTRSSQDALLLTQKLLQVTPQLVKYLSNMSLVSHGALLQLTQDKPNTTAKVLSRCRRGCERARADGRDNSALVMPMNKYLTALPAEKKVVDQQAI